MRAEDDSAVDAFLTSEDIYELHSRVGDLSPHLVVLNCCVQASNNYLMDDVDGIVAALLNCGK